MTWKPIVVNHVLSDYDVSTAGVVRRGRAGSKPGWERKVGHVLKAHSYGGYIYVHLNISGVKQKNFAVHRLVAAAFIGEPPFPGDEVNHKDLHKDHNHVRNLEYLSSSKNKQHAVAHGVQFNGIGEHNSMAKLSDTEATKVRLLHVAGWTPQKLSKRFGLSCGCIKDILDRTTYRSSL